MINPIVNSLLSVAHTLAIHHGLVFEYGDGSLANEVQRLDFEREIALLRAIVAEMDPQAALLVHEVKSVRVTVLPQPFSPDAVSPLPFCPEA